MDENMKFCIEIGTFLLALTASFIALMEYHSNNKIKRAEFLEKLIIEFHDQKTKIAQSLLDDFIYVSIENRTLSPKQQLENAKSLSIFLRDHKIEAITGRDEIEVRESFDHLLDFFTKLSYYSKQHLITPAELSYFNYYISKIKHNKQVETYIKTYYCWDDFLLLFK